ncbi:uncharacterized protein LOC110888379 [Helianthus annuus]|uniref:uncharacterized protein LOC110888379 n=1 Tax=Helianthus annuus TaxID=4232 RepID=UPI000B904D5A|nr:uncharacterized protein LOC110888379 [Helianthus annuus]
MKIRLVVYNGGKWEIVNGKLEYVADAYSSRRGLEIEPNLSYTALLSKVSNMCSSTNITKLSYRLSSFSDPIDIIKDEDLANPNVVAHYLKEPLKDSGRIYRCNEIVKDFRQRLQVEITTSQAWRGKSLALELLQGSSKDSFAELPLYCYNLERANPGSVTHIKTDDERRFEMVFVAIGAAIRTFICNLRPVVIIDAAHLKGEFKGTLFLAVGMDGNNQILPISYGIGKSEDGESWTWFLSKLKECIGEIPEMAIISDRANSIHLAVRNVFPHVYHGLCCRHLMMNLRLPSDKKKKMRSCGGRHANRTDCLILTSHLMLFVLPFLDAESINALSRHSRKMPVTQLLEFFRQSVQKWFYDRRLQGIHEKHLLTQWAQKKIFKKIEGSRTWTVAGIELNSYSVADSGKGGLVDFVNGTCSCRVWQVSGLPCGHVIAVSKFLGETDCSKYCFPCYSNEVYKKTYEEAIYPLPHRSEWETPEDLINLQLPHMTKRQAGRPRENNRILSRGEEPTPLYCSRCNSYGHHRDVCRQPMPSEVRTRKDPDKGKGKETDNPEHFTQSPADYIYPSFNLGDF